jgi:hypothetical protein
MNDIKGISDIEATMLKQVLLFLRSAKPFESLEVKLNDNKAGEFSFMVKSNYKQVFVVEENRVV